MVKNVIEAVIYAMAAKMSEIFANDKGESKYPIYKNGEEQGVDKPCFFIKYLTGEESREIGLKDRFYKDTLNFVIIGYTLEYVTATDGTLLRAMKLHPEIDDGVLHFLIDYKIFVKKENEVAENMNNYDFNEEVKNEG